MEEERGRCAGVAERLQDEAIGIRDPSQAEWDLACRIADAIRKGE